MSRELPKHPDLEALRKQAKHLLRDARAGDAESLRRLRTVPRLDGLDDRGLAAAAVLADAQHALAREHGSESWPKLKQRIEDLQPIEAHAARFLELIRHGDGGGARRLLARHPALARTSLHAACAALELATVERLIAADRARATATDGDTRWTPLMYACASPLDADTPDHAARSARCATLLLDAGADPNSHVIWHGDQKSPLSALYFACVANRPGVVRELLERGANPNDHESVYHSAELDRSECLELLLAHGANMSGRDAHYDNTPLRFLAGYRPGQPGAEAGLHGVRWLLEHGADPNVLSSKLEESALHRAALSGNAEQARLLLEHGADPRLVRKDSRTAYALAVRAGHVDVVALLAEHGAADEALSPADEFLGACQLVDEAAARALLAAQPGIVASLGGDDRVRVAEAASDGRNAAVLLMLRLGFDPTWEAEWCGTPLHWAAWHGNVVLVRELLALGAPVNAPDRNFGSSPIAWAAHGSVNSHEADDDYCAIVGLLLDAGAAREAAINKSGEPPENLGSPRVAALLRERGFTA